MGFKATLAKIRTMDLKTILSKIKARIDGQIRRFTIFVKSRKIYIYLDVNLKALYGRFVIFISGQGRKYKKYLKSIKNIHEGERCFIIGNGPSLKASDLDKIANDVSFASNRIYKIFPETKWRPTYYGIIDNAMFESEDEIKNVTALKCEKKFFIDKGYYLSKKIPGDKCYMHAIFTKKLFKNPKFSHDLPKRIYSFSTVTYSLIQLAVYMGFKKIYLLGMDNSYAREIDKNGNLVINKGVKSYFGVQPECESKNLGWPGENDIVFSYVENYSRQKDFRVFNATRGGKLECFERVDFDTLFE